MSDPHRRLERAIVRIERHLPKPLARAMCRLRHPSAVWLRVPAGGLLVVGGIFSFLPVLGIWMLPLGLVLLAHDIPALVAPVGRVLVLVERRWRVWRRRRRRTAG